MGQEILYEEIKKVNEILVPLIASYKLLVDGACNYNQVTLVHKQDLKKAIKRANEMGKIIDELIYKKLDGLVDEFVEENNSHDE